MSTLAGELGRPLLRLLSRPQAPLSLLLALALVGLLAALPVTSSIGPQLDALSAAPWSARGVDQPLLEDLPWYRGEWRRMTGALWALAGLLALLIFVVGDVALIRAAGPRWDGLLSAWSEGLRRLPALAAVTGLSLGWLALDAFAVRRLIGVPLASYAARVDSEAYALMLGALPDLLWLLFALPVILGAGLARVRLVTLGARSGVLAFGWGLGRSLRSLRVWLLALVIFLGEGALLALLALLRHLWDPRVAVGVLPAIAGVLLILAVRVMAHGVFLGALARWAGSRYEERTPAG